MARPYIALPEQPGILALLKYKPTSGVPLSMLAEAILRGKSSLHPAERELIAAFVSRKNDCVFCYMSHAHVAAVLMDAPFDDVADIINSPDEHATKRVQELFLIASYVTQDFKNPLLDKVIDRSKQVLSEEEIHDAVLIAAAFNMYNRYVEAMGTELPQSVQFFRENGIRLAMKGYLAR